MLALGVIMAHWELAKERHIDAIVLRFFRIEYLITFIGVLFIVAGYLLEIYFYGKIDLLVAG